MAFFFSPENCVCFRNSSCFEEVFNIDLQIKILFSVTLGQQNLWLKAHTLRPCIYYLIASQLRLLCLHLMVLWYSMKQLET